MAPETIRLHQVNGLEFRVLRQGAGDPLILLHGFTGRAESWQSIIDRLAGDYDLHAIDLIGHGASSAPADPARYRFDLAVNDLAAVLDRLGIDRVACLGYSLGGRLALGVAIAHPRRVSALILASATAGIQEENERALRRASDDALAARIEKNGIAAFVAEWESLPMWATQRSLLPKTLAAQRQRRLANSPTGLANSLRGMGQGAQPSLWHRLGDVQAPTLLIAGALDAKFTDLAARMERGIEDAALCLIPHAGHAVHLESPERFSEAVRGFLATQERSAISCSQEVAR